MLNLKKIILYLFVLFFTVLTLILFVNKKTYKNNKNIENLYPNFSEKLNNISRINIKSEQTSYDLAKKNDRWVVPEYDDYPIDLKKINSLLLEISSLKLIEKKTSNPQYFEKIGINIPIRNNKNSKIIRVYDIEDQLLYSFIIGNKSRASSSQNLFYIRRESDEQAWLFVNRMTIYDRSFEWVDRRLFKFGRWRIKNFKVIDHKKKQNNFYIYRDNYSDNGFKLHNLPKNQKVKKPLEVHSIVSTIERIVIKNVLKKSSINKKKIIRSIEIVMFDGQTITIDILEHKNKKLLSAIVKSNISLRKDLPEEGPVIVGLPEMPSEVDIEQEDLRYRFLNQWLYEIDESSLNNLLIDKIDLINKII